jgi:hypothetical protein
MTRAPHAAQIPRLKCAGVPMAPLDQNPLRISSLAA